MSPDQAKPYIDALRPILTRVRTDATAVKKTNGESAWTSDPLTTPLITKHLNGGPARGVSPIKAGESVTMLAVLDLDSHKGETPFDEMVAVAASVCECLEFYEMRPTVFRSSGGRGIHIYVLWEQAQDAYSVRQAIFEALALAGYTSGDGGVARKQIEVFPKQSEVPLDGFGNQFFLPLAGKSSHLDLMFGEDTGIEQIEWRMSAPVPVLQRPAPRERTAAEDIPLAIVRTALAAIPNTDETDSPVDYKHWWRIIASIHAASGGSAEGLALAEEWSQRNAATYAKDPTHLARRVWPYIKDKGEGITGGYVLGQAREKGWFEPHELGFTDIETGEAPKVDATYGQNPAGQYEAPVSADELFAEDKEVKLRKKYDALAVWTAKIDDTNDAYQLREIVGPVIASDPFIGEIERETLAQALVTKLRGLGVKATIAQMRKLIAPKKQRKTENESPLPEWAKGWVYVTDIDKFFRQDSREFLTQQGFRAKFNRVSAPYGDDEDGATDAVRDALDILMIPVVTCDMYLPWAAPLFEHEGVSCVNTYRPSSVPTAVDKLDAKGQEAVDAVRRHVEILADGRPEVVEQILSWIAHNVQKPGVKIRWSPLIKGVEGDGKTILGKVIEACIGGANVNVVSPKALASDFSAWSLGACVAVLEEVRIVGHNRYDIFNALKPYITNDDVPHMKKGKDEIKIRNTQNYIGFTNYNDAMPVDDNSRRWYVVFSPCAHISDLAAALGGDTVSYFNRLHALIESQRASLRRYFLDFQIPSSFVPNGNAPWTPERDAMIGLAVTDDEAVIREVLREGAAGIAPRVLASSYFSTAVQVAGGEALQTSAVSKALIKAGWVKVPTKMKWNGRAEWIWTKGKVRTDNDHLRLELDKTLGTSADGMDEVPESCDDLFG